LLQACPLVLLLLLGFGLLGAIAIRISAGSSASALQLTRPTPRIGILPDLELHHRVLHGPHAGARATLLAVTVRKLVRAADVQVEAGPRHHHRHGVVVTGSCAARAVREGEVVAVLVLQRVGVVHAVRGLRSWTFRWLRSGESSGVGSRRA